MKKNILYIPICYVVLLVLFTALIIGIHLIPTCWFKENVLVSARQIESEGIFRKIGNIYFLQIDNMTDCMMMNMALTADDSHPIESAMNNYYSFKTTDDGYKMMALNTIQLAEKGSESLPEHFHYGRYWQGSQVILRPLLLITNYNGIRMLNYVLMTLLLLWLLWLMVSSFGWGVSTLFIVSLLMVSAPVVPLSIQLSTCFYLMLLAALFIMYHSDIRHSPIYFFVIGALTSYFDFLTTPQLTLGIPLILLILKNQCNHPIKIIILLSFVWLMGYSLLWASKWLIAYILTGVNIMESVSESVTLRLSNVVTFHGVEINILNLTTIILEKIRWWMGIFLGIIVLVLFAVYYKYQKGIAAFYKYNWLIVITLIVPVWFVCLRNHSIQHIFFTWRAFLLPLFSMFLFIYLTLKPQKVYE
ncbi:MAG: hypothetical protein ILA25_02775 [Prevotella sp.]|nr:hypothetical protein [Prevotella sp.]